MVMETFAHQPATFHWYCIQTKPKNEKRALFHLRRGGIETLNPLIETDTSRNRVSKKALEPLFPGYFFAQFDLARDYSTVRWARGVRRVLGNQKGPTPVSEKIIHQIRKRIDSHGVARRPYDLKPEDHVRIKAGPLRDLIGIFERWLPREGRIRILLRLLGYERSVELNYSHVEKVWNAN
jgi:transcriptional antiterminator RfaH